MHAPSGHIRNMLARRAGPLKFSGRTRTKEATQKMVFSPTDMTTQERQTNSGFAAIREVDTTPVRQQDIVRMMREAPRPGTRTFWLGNEAYNNLANRWAARNYRRVPSAIQPPSK